MAESAVLTETPADLNGHAAEPPKRRRSRPSKRRSISQIIRMQDVLHGLVIGKQGRPLELASCARAWADLENRKRELKGVPLPGAFKPGAPVPKQRKAELNIAEQ